MTWRIAMPGTGAACLGGGKARFSIPLLVVLLAGAGCAGADSAEVATLGETANDRGAYLNSSTAAYADCLSSQGIDVAPLAPGGLIPGDEEVPPGFLGYAEIEGAYFLGDSFEASAGTDGWTVGIDGVDRDDEIRDCYEANPGAKDALLDSFDDPGHVEEWKPPQEEIDAGLLWANCAREAGASVIEDPGSDGYVVIPQELELSEAQMLGQECSAPMVDNEYWPLFQWNAGIEDAATGLMDIDAYQEAISGPFVEVMCEENPGTC
jgi:hypothetical protein